MAFYLSLYLDCVVYSWFPGVVMIVQTSLKNVSTLNHGGSASVVTGSNGTPPIRSVGCCSLKKNQLIH